MKHCPFKQIMCVLFFLFEEKLIALLYGVTFLHIIDEDKDIGYLATCFSLCRGYSSSCEVLSPPTYRDVDSSSPLCEMVHTIDEDDGIWVLLSTS